MLNGLKLLGFMAAIIFIIMTVTAVVWIISIIIVPVIIGSVIIGISYMIAKEYIYDNY